MTKQRLTGTVREARHDLNEMTIDFAPDADAPVRIQLTWKAGSKADAQMQEIGEQCEVKAKVVITGWASMPYPHLTHDELAGELHSIEEIW